jgi:hypothetical protein
LRRQKGSTAGGQSYKLALGSANSLLSDFGCLT